MTGQKTRNQIAGFQNFWSWLSLDFKIRMAISGDCMEAMDIYDGDIVDVDLRHMPLPPKYGAEKYCDACLCYASTAEGSSPILMIKQYCGAWGAMQLVGTAYKRKEGSLLMDSCFNTHVILGVICACYGPDGAIRWERDTNNHPVSLSTGTIKGGNCSNPMTIQRN